MTMRTTLRRPITAAAFAAALALTACGQDADVGSAATAADNGTAAFPATVTTAAGDVRIEEEPDAIVSLGATATEMLFAIGAGDQVKAVDEHSNYPTDAPKTDLSSYEPNVEAIIALAPDLVVVANDKGDLGKQLGAADIPLLVLPAAATLDEVYEQFDQLGQATGHPDEADDVATDVRTQLERIAASTPKPDQPVTYYRELTPDHYSATSATFVGQVFGLLGLTSIADKAPGGTSENGGYPQLSVEYVVKANPDIIFLADTKCCQQTPAAVAKRPGWSSIAAVQNKRVIPLDDDVASRWGPRVVELLEAAADALATLNR
jgi:iron complex transport system substrate-binding protein